MLKIACHPIYTYTLPEGHRFPMVKYELLPEQLLYEGTVVNEQFFQPEALDDASILLTHTFDYLHKLNHQLLDRKEIRNIGFPMSEILVRRGKHIANGTYTCAKFAIKNGIAMNIAGGTHHSFADRGEGFCLFNDIAIASNLLLNDGLVEKILIVDLDVHQGNGTARIFENEPRVFTFSMHGDKNYPVRKEKSDLDVGLPDKTNDAQYLLHLTNILPRLIDEVRPDFIFYLSGVDVLESDKLGRLSLTKQGCKNRDLYVLSTAKSHNIPVAVCMGGGYSHKLKDIIEAHANTFRVAQELYF
ncbi:MAG: histone deacetylase [Saprospiraceae bacterium]|nr:histone deacetylase [Saprospiraceae bacterium]